MLDWLGVSKNRIFGLDFLRAIAIIFVVYVHGDIFIKPIVNFRIYNWFNLGGVAIFFVISGYLIGNILIRIIEKKEASLKTLFGFWTRRWIRTLPNYFVVLLFLIGLNVFLGKELPERILSFFTFTQNFSQHHPLFFAVAWSLSIEEWFYLLSPTFIFVLIGLFKSKPKNAVLITIFFMIVFVTFLRFQKHGMIDITNMRAWDLEFRKPVIMRLDSIMFGVLGAYISYYYESFWKKVKIPFFILGIVFLGLHKLLQMNQIQWGVGFGLYKNVFSFTLNALAILFILPLITQWKKQPKIIGPFLTWISIISYSMYVLHVTLVMRLVHPSLFKLPDVVVILFGGNAQLGRYFLYWILTLLISTLMYKFFEKPILNLREKFAISREN